MREKARTSIAIVVLFDGYWPRELKIVRQRIASSTVTLTQVARVTRGGISAIPTQDLSKTSKNNGQKVTEVKKEIGDE